MVNFRRKQEYYSPTFKEQVVARVSSGELSVQEASKHYGIGGSMTIYRWIDKYSASASGEVGENEESNMSKNVTASGSEQAAEIRSLKQLLELERLRSEAYLTMIKMAEERYGIPIEKKVGAKQSR